MLCSLRGTTRLLLLCTLACVVTFCAAIIPMMRREDYDSIRETRGTASEDRTDRFIYGHATQQDIEDVETMSHWLVYSKLWYVGVMLVYFIMVSSKELVSPASKSRGYNVCLVAVAVCLASGFKHAFESGPFYNPSDPFYLSVYCTKYPNAAPVRYDAFYVFACLPEEWATRMDYMAARVAVYTTAFFVMGAFELQTMLCSQASLLKKSCAAAVVVAPLMVALFWDLEATVIEPDGDKATVDSIYWGVSSVVGPWVLLAMFIEKKDNEFDCTVLDAIRFAWGEKKTCYCVRLFCTTTTIVLAYISKDQYDDLSRTQHVVWHICAGVTSMGALTLTPDWTETMHTILTSQQEGMGLRENGSRSQKTEPRIMRV